MARSEKEAKKAKKAGKVEKVEKKTKKAAKPEKATKVKKAAKAEKTKKKAKRIKEVAPVVPVKEKLSAGGLIKHLVNVTELDKRTVKTVMEALSDTIKGSICKKGSGEFTFPKLFKIGTKHVPATKARKGINPFTKEPTVFKAKPATTKVKLRAMKLLKEVAVS